MSNQPAKTFPKFPKFDLFHTTCQFDDVEIDGLSGKDAIKAISKYIRTDDDWESPDGHYSMVMENEEMIWATRKTTNRIP